MIAEVATAIMDKFKADLTFKNALSGGLYFQQAPQAGSLPYGVFYLSSVTQEEIMGTADDNITNIDLQFNIFSEAKDGGEEICTLTDLLTKCFDWQTLNTNGYHHIRMQRENILPMVFTDDIWQTTINYTLGIQKE